MLGRWGCKVALGIWAIGSNGLSGCCQPRAWVLSFPPVSYSSRESISWERALDWHDLAITSPKISSRTMGQGLFTEGKVRLQRDGLGRKNNRHPQNGPGPLQVGSQLLPSFWAEVFIHPPICPSIPPTMSTCYELDNVLDANNTVLNSSVVQVV